MTTLSHRKWKRGAWSTYMLWCYRRTDFSGVHDHTFYELFWVESGRGRYWINGRVEPLEAGDLVLVRPEDRHGFAAAKAGEFVEFVNVAFLPRLWLDLQRRFFRRRPAYFGLRSPQSRRHRLLPSQILRLQGIASGLRAGARDRLAVEAFVGSMLSMLEEPAEARNPPEAPHWLSLALEQVRLYPNFAGGPAAFARLAGKSPEHLARECRRCLGRKPNDLVNEARMEYAARELQMDQKTIVDIALECGIENLGHFYQLFRKRYGLSPARYRRKNQEPVQYA